MHHIHLAPSVQRKHMYGTVYLYMNMTKPSEQLILTWSEQDASVKEKAAFFYIEPDQECFPQMKLQRVRMNEEQNTDFWHNYQFLIRGLREISENGQIQENWQEVYDWFYSNPEYKGRPGSWWRLLSIIIHGDPLSQAAVKAIYGGQLTGGVTMLENMQPVLMHIFFLTGFI